jgi:hypothetical protein
VLLFQAATSLPFRFLVVMPFAGFLRIIFGESPVALYIDTPLPFSYTVKK